MENYLISFSFIVKALVGGSNSKPGLSGLLNLGSCLWWLESILDKIAQSSFPIFSSEYKSEKLFLHLTN